LGDYVKTIFCGRDPTGGKSVHSSEPTGYRVVQSAPVFDGYIVTDKLGFISKEIYQELQSASLQEDDVLLNQLGDGITFARSCVTPSEILPAIITRSVGCIRCDKNKLNPWFLNAYLILPQTKQYIESFNSGSSRRAIDGGKMRSFIIPLPPIEEQRAIGTFYQRIQQKIELNRRTNETLEQMARALFKSWFVDFEPVRAKMEERATGLPPEIDRLFPDSFEESELGEVPTGWKIKKVEDVASKVACGPFGSSIKVSTFVNDGVPVISGQHLWNIRLKDGDNNFVTIEHADKLKNANVFRQDIIFTHAGSVGQAAIIPERYILSQRQFYLRCNLDIVSPQYMVYFFNSSEGQHKLLANISSTGVPSISQPVSYLKSIEFLLPPKELTDKFSEFIRIYHLNEGIIELESSSLSSIRDTLLPKLLSGEVRIPDVEGFLRERGIEY